MLKIFNSLTKEKQIFTPIEAGKVKMYICGMTVYDLCHIGHARSSVVFDTIRRYLSSRDYDVTFVRNITDIDDKIIKRAAENCEAPEELTQRFIDAMHTDEGALGVQRADHEPRATEYVDGMIKFIQTLIKKDYAYVAENGDVCYEVRKFESYGKLSQRKIDDLISGARVGVQDGKRDPLDFVLWKLAKPGEPTWGSPWGDGRPGWHIECSCMASDLLGQPFDIHGGGLDLKFPHHENEIAQSEAAFDKPFANLWMHAGLLNIDGQKMSKSLGNFFTIRDVLEEHHPETVRYFMLSGHYRSPVNYSAETLQHAQGALLRLYTAMRQLPIVEEAHTEAFETKFNQAMDDDFNTPEAFSVLFELAHEINRLREKNDISKAAGLTAGLKRLGNIFGLLKHEADIFMQGDTKESEISEIDQMIADRINARAEKNWAEADAIRDKLTKKGVVIEDDGLKTTWRRA